MHQKLNDPVSVVMYYSAKQQHFQPHVLQWQNREYKVGEIGFHHRVRDGRVIHHIFECVDTQQTMAFRLNFNTEVLSWTLEAVSDGMGA